MEWNRHTRLPLIVNALTTIECTLHDQLPAAITRSSSARSMQSPSAGQVVAVFRVVITRCRRFRARWGRPDAKSDGVFVPAGVVLLAVTVQDTLSRPLRDLRISVTDRCNFRCTYCMPKDVFGPGFVFLRRADLLTFEEIARAARLFVARGRGRRSGSRAASRCIRRDLEQQWEANRFHRRAARPDADHQWIAPHGRARRGRSAMPGCSESQSASILSTTPSSAR